MAMSKDSVFARVGELSSSNPSFKAGLAVLEQATENAFSTSTPRTSIVSTITKVISHLPKVISSIPPETVHFLMMWLAFVLEDRVNKASAGKSRFATSTALLLINGLRSLGSGAVVGLTEAIKKATDEKRSLTTDEVLDAMSTAFDASQEVLRDPAELSEGQFNHLTFVMAVTELRQKGWITRMGTTEFYSILHRLSRRALYTNGIAKTIPEMDLKTLEERLAEIDAFLDLTEIARDRYKRRRQLSGKKVSEAKIKELEEKAAKTPLTPEEQRRLSDMLEIKKATEAQKNDDDVLEPTERDDFNKRRELMEKRFDECRRIFAAIHTSAEPLGPLERVNIFVAGYWQDNVAGAGGGERLADTADNVKDFLLSRRMLGIVFVVVSTLTLIITSPMLVAGFGLTVTVGGVIAAMLLFIGAINVNAVYIALTIYLGNGIAIASSFALAMPVALLANLARNPTIDNQFDGRSGIATVVRQIASGVRSLLPFAGTPENNDTFVETRLNKIPWRDPNWLRKPVSGMSTAGAIVGAVFGTALYVFSLLLPDGPLWLPFSGFVGYTTAYFLMVGSLIGYVTYEVWFSAKRYKSVMDLKAESLKFEAATYKILLNATKVVGVGVVALIVSALGMHVYNANFRTYSCPSTETMTAMSETDLVLIMPNRYEREYCIETRIVSVAARVRE